MSLRSMLWHRAAIYSKTAAADSAGGLAYTYSLLIGSLPCNVQTPTWRTLEQYKQADETPSAVLYHDTAGLSIAVGDRVVFTGSNYRVIGVTDQLQLDVFWRVDLVKEQV